MRPPRTQNPILFPNALENLYEGFFSPTVKMDRGVNLLGVIEVSDLSLEIYQFLYRQDSPYLLWVSSGFLMQNRPDNQSIGRAYGCCIRLFRSTRVEGFQCCYCRL